MTLLSSVLITLVVWAVSSIRSIRWRSLVYSLPLPITLVLVTTSARVDGSQILGVVALNIFIAVVALTHVRLGWHIMLADLTGVAAYVGLGLVIAAFAPLPFWPLILAVIALWAVVTLWAAPVQRDTRAAPPQPWPGVVVKLGAVFGAALLMVALSGFLKGLIVTFPYSGVLVAIETRRHLSEFARHFARNSIALAAFFTGYHLLRDHGEPIALAAGWIAFAACALALYVRRDQTLIPGGTAGNSGADR